MCLEKKSYYIAQFMPSWVLMRAGETGAASRQETANIDLPWGWSEHPLRHSIATPLSLPVPGDGRSKLRLMC